MRLQTCRAVCVGRERFVKHGKALLQAIVMSHQNTAHQHFEIHIESLHVGSSMYNLFDGVSQLFSLNNWAFISVRQ